MGRYYFFPGERANTLWVPDIYLDKTPNIRYIPTILHPFLKIIIMIALPKCNKVTEC